MINNFYRIPNLIVFSIFLLPCNVKVSAQQSDNDHIRTGVLAGNSKTIEPQIKARVSRWMAHEGAIGFEENKGQMADIDGKPLPGVFFKISAPGITMFITEKGITYMFSKAKEELKNENEKESREEENLKIRYCRIDMNFKGATILKKNIIKENPSETNFNFFYNHCPQGIYGVKQFQKITIKDIYPGIDWKIYNSSDKGFKYDFIVHPGADPEQIELIYSSLKPAELNTDGNIIIETETGTLTENAPVSFQNNNKITTRFNKIHNLRNAKGGYDTHIKFDLSTYDNSGILTIDPQLWWGTFYGGGSNVYGGPLDITTDANNDFYVAGYAEGTGTGAVFPNQAWAGAYYDNTKGGYDDAFILKFSGTGVLIWSTMYGGGAGGFAENDFGSCLTVDNSGNLFVAGSTTSAAFPLLNLPGAYNDNIYNGGTSWGDIFILKFDNLGVRQWATFYGGSGDDAARDIITDNLGNIWITGQTNSANFPVLALGGAFNQATYGGGEDAIILKFSAAGALQWSTYYGGFNNDRGTCFSISNAGSFLLINGDTDSPNFPTQSSGTAYFDNTLGGISDAFVLKISFTGVRQWATLLGGSSEERGYGIVQDNSGNIYTSGKTVSVNFPTLSWGGAFFDNTLNGPSDIYITKFISNGTLQWSTYFGGNGTDYESTDGYPIISFNSIQTDACGNIYVGFTTNSINNPIVNNSCDYVQSNYGGGVSDVFLVKFDNSGALVWSTYFGGVDEEFWGRIAIDNLNNLFVSGEYRRNAAGGTLPFVNPGAGAYFDNSSNQQDDLYILKLIPVPLNLSSTSTGIACGGGAVAVTTTCINSKYSYSWSPGGQTTSYVSGLPLGSYTVTVSDNSCHTATTIVSVSNSIGALVMFTNPVNVSCNGINNGSASVTVIGGAGPFTYSWSTTPVAQTSPNATGLGAGTYTVSVSNASGCASSATFSITQPSAIILSSTIANTTCNNANGSVEVVAFGGTQSSSILYNYTWSPNIGTNSSIGALSSGTYTVTVSDANGCTKSTAVVVGSSAGANASFTQAPGTTVCIGTIVSFTNTGTAPGAGVTHNWLISTITPINVSGTTANFSYAFLSTGTYNVSHTVNSSGCNANVSRSITVINCSAGPNVIATGSSVCPGACATVTTNGTGGSTPYTYSWSNAATTQNISPCPVATTTYTVTIHDAGGSTSTSTAVVTVSPAVIASVSSTGITCNGDANGLATAAGGGGSLPYTYVWSPPGGSTTVVSGLTSGTYTVTVTDNKGCTSVSTTTVISPPALAGQFAKGTANCAGCGCKEWIMVNAAGGTSPYSYTWPDGFVNRYKNQLCPGGYSVNIKDKNGCSINVSLTAP